MVFGAIGPNSTCDLNYHLSKLLHFVGMQPRKALPSDEEEIQPWQLTSK